MKKPKALTREGLSEYLSDEEIAQLSDEDLEKIAQYIKAGKMKDGYGWRDEIHKAALWVLHSKA